MNDNKNTLDDTQYCILCEQAGKEIERLNALVAMQAEALKDSIPFIGYGQSVPHLVEKAENALSASSSTVAAWEAEYAAKVLEEFIKTLRGIPSIGLSERQFGELERATKVKE